MITKIHGHYILAPINKAYKIKQMSAWADCVPLLSKPLAKLCQAKYVTYTKYSV